LGLEDQSGNHFHKDQRSSFNYQLYISLIILIFGKPFAVQFLFIFPFQLISPFISIYLFLSKKFLEAILTEGFEGKW
jgi:hypothetical protein